MPNDLSSNPWIIDTTGDQVLYRLPLHNVQAEYIDYANSTDSVEIQDRNNKVVWRAQGALDLATRRSGRVGWIEGFKVPTRDSDGKLNMATGKVVLYFE
jgi:hypothetical protein